MKININFVLLIISIYFIEIYTIECNTSYFGENCNITCDCKQWSNTNKCSKTIGNCLDCKFGHFGKKCGDRCYPKCKTNICCKIKSEQFEDKNDNSFEIITSLYKDLPFINIKINGTDSKILLDFNNGYPLFIKNQTIDVFDETINYTYFKIMGWINPYYTELIFFDKDNKERKLNLKNVVEGKINNDNISNEYSNFAGVMGIGFFNSISEYLFPGELNENIISYEINDDDQVSVFFGDLSDDAKDYLYDLASYDVLDDDNNNQSQVIFGCNLDGIKIRDFSDALKVEDTIIKFNFNNKHSTFVLDNSYKSFFTKYYFDEDYEQSQKIVDGINYFCYDEIHKMDNFGFVMKNYYYSYLAENFFSEEECNNKKYKFLIGFSNRQEDIGITLGRNFLKNTKIIIDIEEKKIYMHAREMEFFTGKILIEFAGEPGIKLTALDKTLIAFCVIVVMNVVSFLLYFFCKKRKENNRI